MESLAQVVHDPYLLSRIIAHLEDHFDILNLSLASKFHRQTVLSNVQRIRCRRLGELQEIPTVFPSLTKLDLGCVPDELHDSVFTILLPKLSDLQILKIGFPFETVSQIERTPLATLETLTHLKVLNLEECHLDDKIAKHIGERCKLLQDITLTSVKGPFTNNGLSDLLLSSTFGLRRLSFRCQECPKDNPMLVIIKCSTLTCLDIKIDYIDPSVLSFPISDLKLKCIREFRFSTTFKNRDNLDDDMAKFVEAIIRAGSPLEIVELDASLSENCLRLLCDCKTLNSLVIEKEISVWGESIVHELILQNHAPVSVRLHGSPFLNPKAMVERTLSIEGTRVNCDQNIENVLDFFSRNQFFRHYKFFFGFYEGFSRRITFLQELTLCFSVGWVDVTYEGLYELLSICTLLRKVDIQGSSDSENPRLCRALNALIGCRNLVALRAPVGNKTLRHILGGVKGLRLLEVKHPREEFSDEALLVLKENAFFLRDLYLSLPRRTMDRITDRGLEGLSFCTQLQSLHISGYIGASGVSLIRKRCLWLNRLFIETYGCHFVEIL